MKPFFLVLAAIFTLTATLACAGAPQTASGLPDGPEITAFVRANWDGAFELQTAYAAGRQEQASTLLSVEDVRCRSAEGHIVCSFSPKVRFSGDKVVTVPLEGHFRRTVEGGLEEMVRIERPPS